jgi:hypothetical protein
LPIQQSLAPYLYPCTVEYSLTCLAIFFIIWKNIGEKEKEFGYILKLNDIESTFNVDCNKTSRGLFCGIIVALVTIVANIMYFIYKKSPEKSLTNDYSMKDLNNITTLFKASANGLQEGHRESTIIIEILEIVLIVLSASITIAALNRTRKLPTIELHSIEFDELLLVVSLCGIYVFSVFSSFSIIYNNERKPYGYLSLATSIISIIEGTLQTYLIFSCLKRRAVDPKDRQEKPGRELFTILIIINLCLWVSDTFAFKTFEVSTYQLDYYSILTWSIISTISTPLAIFFRFHSSVCLSDCWKSVYL